jgi:hypothetical protein
LHRQIEQSNSQISEVTIMISYYFLLPVTTDTSFQPYVFISTLGGSIRCQSKWWTARD